MSDQLYRENEPSGCILSDSCNLIFAISEDPDPFMGMDDTEFRTVMAELAMSINIISTHMEIIQGSEEIDEIFGLLQAMKDVNQKAVAEVNENRKRNI